MELNGAKILYTIHTNIPLLGDFKITQTLVSTWIVMVLLSGFAIWLGSNLKRCGRSNESGKAALFCQPDRPAQNGCAGINACGVRTADSGGNALCLVGR